MKSIKDWKALCRPWMGPWDWKSALKKRLKLFSSRKRTHGAHPWWRKDIKEILIYLRREKAPGGSTWSLASLKDVAAWSPGFRYMILGLAYVLSFTVGGSLLWTGTQNSLRVLVKEQQALQIRYVTYAQQVALLPMYRIQRDQIHEQFGALLDAIPPSLESVHVLAQLNQAAKEAGITLELFKPLTEVEQSYYVVLPVEVRLRGSFNAMARFLELVSQMKHLITVDIVLVPSATHGNQIVLASLLKAYRYREMPVHATKKVAQ